jgi:hypothetical protein
MIWWILIPIVILACIPFMITRKYNQLETEYENYRVKMENMVRELSNEKDVFKKRVFDLEDAIQKEYGVKIRNEVTEVHCDFDKLEMVIFLAGIYQLIDRSGEIEDKEHYIKLYKKVQSFVDKMEEKE